MWYGMKPARVQTGTVNEGYELHHQKSKPADRSARTSRTQLRQIAARNTRHARPPSASVLRAHARHSQGGTRHASTVLLSSTADKRRHMTHAHTRQSHDSQLQNRDT